MPVPRRGRLRDWLHELARDTARAAQRALRTRAPHRIVQMGASGSPTSALDAYAERVLIDALPDAPVPLNLLSEEVGVIDRGADWWLVADPVDGTRNALHGVPFYCVSLAIGRRDLATIEMGLVESIPTPGTWYAEKGAGARFAGRRLRAPRRGPRDLLVGAALDYDANLRLARPGNVHFRDLGSAALEMCHVAEGHLDAFVSRQPIVRVIDVAASTLVVREAGGQVLDLRRRPLNVAFDARARFPLIALRKARLWGAIGA